MKIKLLMATLLGLITVTAFAQKKEVDNAQSEYSTYTTLGAAKATAVLAATKLKNAKESIDKASANPKTAALPQTYALKAAIYTSLAVSDTVATTATADFTTANDALQKAKETDTKGENKNLIAHASVELAQYHLNMGVKQFQDKKYDEAYKSFDAARQIIPDDTTAIINTAIAATNAKNYAASIANYNKLLTTNYSKKLDIYNDLPTLYMANKDTAGAIKSVDEALVKYPNNADLRKTEIVISLQSGQQNDLINKIDNAIKSEPNNKTLYYYEGLTYSQIAEGASKTLKKLQKNATKAAPAKPGVKPVADPQIAKLQQTKADNFAKAAEQYKKALAIDPNYFEANLNLGYVTIAPAIDAYNDAQQLPVNQVKEYNAAMAKVNTEFDVAKPYLLKAVELNPKSLDALTNLKSYYLGKKDTANANAVQKQIDALH